MAKLLGWLSGPIRSKVIRVTEHGISEDQLPFLHSMEGSLEEQLMDLREASRQEFVAALEEDASYGVLKAKEEAVANAESLIRKAHGYRLDIDEELANGADSAIEIDREMSEREGVTYLTLRSLDRWAGNKYKIAILEHSDSAPPSEGNEAQATAQTEENESPPRAMQSLQTTLAFLVEAFASTAEKYGKDKPNVSAIARHIEDLAAQANKGQVLLGQGHVSIKKRIDAAMRVKKEKLSER